MIKQKCSAQKQHLHTVNNSWNLFNKNQGMPWKNVSSKSHGIYLTSPLFFLGRKLILLPRFDALPLELAESLLAIAVFCCDFSRKKTLAAGNSWVYISTVP